MTVSLDSRKHNFKQQLKRFLSEGWTVAFKHHMFVSVKKGGLFSGYDFYPTYFYYVLKRA